MITILTKVGRRRRRRRKVIQSLGISQGNGRGKKAKQFKKRLMLGKPNNVVMWVGGVVQRITLSLSTGVEVEVALGCD